MPKRKKRAVLESSSGESDCPDDLHGQLLLLAKRRKIESKTSAQHSQPEGSRSTWGATRSDGSRTVHGKGSIESRKSKLSKKTVRKNRSSNIGADSKSSASSEPEEGEVSDSDDSSSQLAGDSSSDSSSSDSSSSSSSSSISSSSSDEKGRAQGAEEEREQELVDRAVKRGRLQTRFRMKNKLRLAKRHEQKRKTAQGGSSTSSSSGGKGAPTTSRCQEWRRMVEKRKGKFSKKVRATKAERQKKRKQVQKEKEEKKQKFRAEGEARVKAPKKLRVSDVYSDDDGDGASDKDGGQGGDTSERRRSCSSFSSRDEREPQVPVAKEDIGKIRLTRHQLKPWIHAPFFAEKVTGCFVRIRIGSRHGRAVYRLMQVAGVVETAKVHSPGINHTSLRLRHGRREKVRRLRSVSNQEFTDWEFQKWKKLTVSFPSSEEVARKTKDIQDALNEEQPCLQDPRSCAAEKCQKEIAEQEGNREAQRPARELDQPEKRPH